MFDLDEVCELLNFINKNRMKTILVVYTNGEKLSEEAAYRAKKYSFNTAADVKIGDVIESPAYTSTLQVVKILDKKFDYVNVSTGELSDEFNSTSQWKIRELVIGANDPNVIHGKIK